MKTIKQLGIYIDFTNAFLMELINKKIISRNIEFEYKVTESNINPDVPGHKHAEHHLPPAYYLEICDIINNYNQVVLFGPNDAKNELFNLLEFDHKFDSIKIQNVNTDKLSEIQIRDFFNKYYE